MKVQKLGIVLSMNIAAACLFMQGCKATKPGQEVPPGELTVATDVPPPAPAPAPQVAVKSIPDTPAAPVVRQDPLPEKPVQVKPLPPPPPKKPVATVAPVAGAAPAAGAQAQVYRIQKGDTLGAIARRNGVKVSAIVAANPGLNPNRIIVGKKLNIPAGSAVAPAAAPKTTDAKVVPAAASATAASVKAPVKTKPAFKPYDGATKEYKVKSGDSLGKIAHENGITIRALKELNGLKNDMVRVGQTLKVPAEKVVAVAPKKDVPAAKPAEKKEPEVKKAASAPAPAAPAAPAAEAEKPAAPAAAPAAEAEKPAAPAAEAAVTAAAPAAAPAAEAEKPAAPEADGAGTYTVKDGDDIVSVAITYGISPSQLLDANDLKPGTAIKPGMVLKLPANAKLNQ